MGLADGGSLDVADGRSNRYAFAGADCVVSVEERRASLVERFGKLPYRAATINGLTVEDAAHNALRFKVMAEIGDFNRRFPYLTICPEEIPTDVQAS